MVKKEKWLKSLQTINLLTMEVLVVVALSTFFIPFEQNWRYLPVFKFQIFEADKLIEIFVHAYLFAFNLGFFFQLFILLFSFMIFFSMKRNISFHMMYILVILRSLLILAQNYSPPLHYITKNENDGVIAVQCFYLAFFTILFALNLIYDTKKGPR